MALQNFTAHRLPTIKADWLNAVDRQVTQLLTSVGTDTGVANAAVVASNASIPEFVLAVGTVISFIPAATNTGAATLNVNGTGAAAIINQEGSALTGGELSVPLSVRWTGAAWRIVAGSIPVGNARTAAELAAGVIPVNYQYPNHLTCGYALAERYGTNANPGTTDMRDAVQAAVNVAAQADSNVGIITKCRLGSSVNIDRAVDTAAADSYLRIVGLGEKAGFYATGAVNMFSSSIPFTTVPVVQMVRFEDINFEQVDNSFDAYVLHDARYCRTQFIGCDFIKIKCLTAAAVYTQSIYFWGCNMRRWAGVFYNALGTANFDIKFTDCLLEAGGVSSGGGDGVVLNLPSGCHFVNHTSEGHEATTAIRCIGSQGLFINAYFEGNFRDIDLTAGSHLGAVLLGCQFASTLGGGENVYWGIAEGCASIGCYSSGSLHNLTSASKVAIRDYAPVAITNRAGYSEIPYNVPLFDARNSVDQVVTTSTFTLCTLGAEVIDTNTNFAASRFTATITGYYLFDCRLNAKAVGGAISRVIVSLYKGGAELQRVTDLSIAIADGTSAIVGGTAIVLMNAGEFVELYGFITGAGTPTFGFNAAPEACRFSGSFLRSQGI